MRFRVRQTVSPYLKRRVQFRMLAMIALLVLIVLAIRVASRPSSWYWLTGRPDTAATAHTNPDSKSPDQIDFNVRLDDSNPLPPGMFRSVPSRTEHAIKRLGERSIIDAETSSTDDEPNADVVAQTEIDPALLAAVKDNTLGVRHAEKTAHDAILAKIRDLPPDVARQHARHDASFTVLMLESDAFRGKLVTITGEVKRLLKFTATKNDFQLNDLYEAWILTPDSGNNLYRVVCTSIPGGLAESEQFTRSVPVRVTGYFFKRYGYATVQNRLHATPLILARTLEPISVRPVPAIAKNDNVLVISLVAFAGLVAVILAVVAWRYSVGDRRFQRTRLNKITAASDEAIQSLANVEQTDVADLFRAMTEEAREADHTVSPPADAKL